MSMTEFFWSELSIPFECPAFDCTDLVPPDLPLSLITLFRHWSEATHNHGHSAIEVLRWETRICIEIQGLRLIDKSRGFAKEKGYADVNLVALPERILRWEKDILLLVSDVKHRNSSYCWEFLIDEVKSAGSSLEALEKGKSVPHEITEHVRPG